jgi:hypothetical protein
LLKLYCLQWICDSLLELSYLQQISIRCRKRVGCNEVAFAVKIVAPARKHFLLPNCAAYSEPVFAVELYSLPNQVSLLISIISLLVRNDSNVCNNFIVKCGTLECEHMNSWNKYSDKCDSKIQMYWFMTIDVLGGAAGRWLPPSFFITLIYEMHYHELLSYCVSIDIKLPNG